MSNYVLVGCGFLGKHILTNLLADAAGGADNSVTIIDKIDADKFFTHPQTRIYKKDRRIRYLWQSAKGTASLLKEQAIQDSDGIIITMAIADVPYAMRDPIDTYDSNVMGTLQFFELLRTLGYDKRVIILSSESIYGHQPAEKLPLREDTLPQPVNVYGSSKLAQEQIALTYHRSYGIKTTVIRSATMYGPYCRPTQAIPVFAQQILLDNPVTLMGDKDTEETASRDFISVIDVASAVITALMTPDPIEGEIFNIGAGREVQLLNLVNAMKRLCGKPSDEYDKQGVRKENYIPIKWIPFRAGEKGLRVVLDTTKTKEKLKWEASIDFLEGLRHLIFWAGQDIMKFQPDEMDLLSQILWPHRYTVDPKSKPQKIGETYRMSEEEWAEHKKKQQEELAKAAEKRKSTES
jgi:nucleoside-diphosphate-sugar epimerase